MRAFFAILLGALLSCGALAAEEGAARLKVLLVTGGHGFDAEAFFKVFQDNQEIEFTAAKHAKNADVYERPDLLEYRAVVLYDMPKTITDEQKARFLSLFAKGIGVVVLHHALVSYPDWPEYAKIIGGHYSQQDEKTGLAGYQHNVDIPVQIVAKAHPITAGLADFLIHDEIYWGFRVQPDVTPLLTTTHPQSGKPLSWCRTQGASRVVYLQLGHGPTAFENPNYRKLVAACIRWAARTETLK